MLNLSIPYPLTITVTRMLCSVPPFRQWLFARHIRQLAKAMKLADPSAHTQDQLTCRVLSASLNRRSLAAYVAVGSRRADRWFRIDRSEILAQAVEKGKGVVLANAHFGCGRIVPLAVAKLGYEILSIHRGNPYEDLDLEQWPLTIMPLSGHPMASARAALIADRMLRQGKICHLAADGFRFGTGIETTFLGIRKTFAAGFAQLAVDTGATVIPVIAPIDRRGCITVRFFDPLETTDQVASRQEKVEQLIHQYVHHVEQAWKTYPGNVTHRHLRHYQELSDQVQTPAPQGSVGSPTDETHA